MNCEETWWTCNIDPRIKQFSAQSCRSRKTEIKQEKNHEKMQSHQQDPGRTNPRTLFNADKEGAGGIKNSIKSNNVTCDIVCVRVRSGFMRRD